MTGTVTRTKSAHSPSIFPLHFSESGGPYEQLEDYCNGQLKDKENKLRILQSADPNIYRGELTEKRVSAQFQFISGTEEWKRCKIRGTFCSDPARGRNKPCYCRYLFRGHHMVPVYLLHIPQFGLGVFARNTIKEGEFIMDYQGEFKWADDADDVENGRYSVELRTFMGTSTDIEMDASRIGGLGRFLNHSCDANVKAFPILMDETVRLVIMATKNIKPFQQLCWNYGPEYFSDRGLACLCGSKQCQVKPANDDEKSKENRKAYLKFLKEHQQTGPLEGKQSCPRTVQKRQGNSSAAEANKQPKMDKLILRAEHDDKMATLRTELEAQRDYWRNKSREFEDQLVNGTEAEDDHEDEPSMEPTPSGEACEDSDSGPDMMTITKAEHDKIVDQLRLEIGADVEYWKEKAKEMKKWISDNATEMSSDKAIEGQEFAYPDVNTLDPTLGEMDMDKDDDDDQPDDPQQPAPAVTSGTHITSAPNYRDKPAPMMISQISSHPQVKSYDQMQTFLETIAHSKIIPVQSYHIKGNFTDGIPKIMNDFFRLCGSQAVSLELFSFQTEDFQNHGFTLEDLPITPNLGQLRSLQCRDFNFRETLGFARFIRMILNGARALEEFEFRYKFHVNCESGTAFQLKKTLSLVKMRQLEENITKRIPNSLRVLKLSMNLSEISFNNLIGIGLKLKEFVCNASYMGDGDEVAFYKFLESQATTLEVLRVQSDPGLAHPLQFLPIREPINIQFPPLPKVNYLELGYSQFLMFCFLKTFPQLHGLDMRRLADSNCLDELLSSMEEEAKSVKKIRLPERFSLAPLVDVIAERFPNVTHLFFSPKPAVGVEGIVETLHKVFDHLVNVEELRVCFPEKVMFNLDSVLSGVSERNCERIREGDFDTVKLDALQTKPSILKLTKLRKLMLNTELDEHILTNFSAHFIFLRMASLEKLCIRPSKLTPKYIERLMKHVTDLELIGSNEDEGEDCAICV